MTIMQAAYVVRNTVQFIATSIFLTAMSWIIVRLIVFYLQLCGAKGRISNVFGTLTVVDSFSRRENRFK